MPQSPTSVSHAPATNDTTGVPTGTFSSAWVAWYAVGVLMVLYICSFVDRQILSLLVAPIRRDFGMTNTQIGMLQGLAFAILYTTLGLPLGWLADRMSRRRIIAGGVFFWSLAATACGMAANAAQLFLARIGVGIGEAALSPSAYSLITDYFKPEKLGRAFGVYNMGITIGSGIALIVGGVVVSWVSAAGETFELPFIGPVRAWQLVFIVTGVPGLLLCLLMLTVPEPPRRGLIHTASAEGPKTAIPLRQVVRFILERGSLYGLHFISFALLAAVGYGMVNWAPTAFSQDFGLPIGTIAMGIGSIVVTCGSLGMYGAGRISDLLTARGRQDAAVVVCIGIALCTGITGTLAQLTDSLVLLWALTALMNLTIASYSALAPMAIGLVTPNQMRGQVSAVYLLVINLIGLGFGPVIVPVISDHVLGDPSKLRISLAIVCALCCTISAVLLYALRPIYARHVEEAAQWR
jgi:MFS family permease